MTHSHLSSAKVREQLKHPIIDGDGHFVEVGPILDDELAAHLEEVGGKSLRDKYIASGSRPFNTANVLAGRDNPAVKQEMRAAPSWWGWQTKNTLDRATSHLPKLTYNRMDEMGLDFIMMYPSTVLGLIHAEGEMGAAVARAANKYLAGLFAPYKDRIAVGAIIPMDTPQLAIAELEYAVKELGAKSVVIAGYAKRKLGDKPANGPQGIWADHYGIDSYYDYDPFWKRCVELKVAPVSHSSHMHLRVSRSTSNYVFNHIGCLGTSHESLAKSLFMSGVTRRFPTLRVGFLEGGVSWACQLYSDLIGHWSKRNAENIMELDPDRLDVPKMMDYFKQYGDETMVKQLDRLSAFFSAPAARPEQLDDFHRVLIKQAEDIRDLFVPNFYFGCEADDPMVAWAFNDKVNPMGAKLRAMFGSDIAHWDVVDMTEPVEEAWEMVENGIITEDNFRDFAFMNPLRLHAGMNPDVFKGTIIEKAAADAVKKGL
ncbi:MAG: amidohydrolase family protein [Rhodospirillaceae bacterium]|nr:amidohydrolase family protein [Rhodospirillaceae bacterium]